VVTGFFETIRNYFCTVWHQIPLYPLYSATQRTLFKKKLKLSIWLILEND